MLLGFRCLLYIHSVIGDISLTEPTLDFNICELFIISIVVEHWSEPSIICRPIRLRVDILRIGVKIGALGRLVLHTHRLYQVIV